MTVEDDRIAAFEHIKAILLAWHGNCWGSSVTPDDDEILDVLKKITDEFPGDGEFPRA